MKFSKVTDKEIVKWKHREVLEILTTFECKKCGKKITCHIKTRKTFGDICYNCKPENMFKLPRTPV